VTPSDSSAPFLKETATEPQPQPILGDTRQVAPSDSSAPFLKETATEPQPQPILGDTRQVAPSDSSTHFLMETAPVTHFTQLNEMTVVKPAESLQEPTDEKPATTESIRVKSKKTRKLSQVEEGGVVPETPSGNYALEDSSRTKADEAPKKEKKKNKLKKPAETPESTVEKTDLTEAEKIKRNEVPEVSYEAFSGQLSKERSQVLQNSVEASNEKEEEPCYGDDFEEETLDTVSKKGTKSKKKHKQRKNPTAQD